jgi:amino acid adenylation domain-containing protein
LYTAERGGMPSSLPASVRFASYARDRMGFRETADYAEAEAYWTKRFTGSVPVLELPVDRPRPAVRTYAAGCHTRSFPSDLVAVVKRVCEERGCTPFALLLSTFNLLLHRLSTQDDLIVGVPAAGQVLEGMENLVGHCANLMPIRSRCVDEQPFSDYFATSRHDLLEALDHWRYPFGDLIRKLQLPRDVNRVPLVNVVFNYSRLRGAPHYEGLSARFSSNPKSFLYFDLIFDFTAIDDELVLNCHHSSELFDETTIERFIGHYEHLLRSIAANPATPVSRLPLLSEAEVDQIVVGWNKTTADFPQDRCIHELFAEQVVRTPRATALVYGKERFAYCELDAWSDAIAHRLRELGVGPDKRVGVFLTRTPALIASLLGVLKAGGAYVPLDPAYPRDRLAMILEDSKPQVLITSEKLQHLNTGEARVLTVESIDVNNVATPAVQTADRGEGSRNLAYVLYTSGSTGRPKGVEIEHRSVVALVAWAQATYQPDEYAGVLASTSVCFDISVYEIFFPLCSGGKVILAENVLHLSELPAVAEITLINTVPSAAADLIEVGGIPASVRTINLAGEALPQDLVDGLYRRTSVKRVVDLYGPTETTVYSTGTVRQAGGRASIGRPLANEETYILDPFRQPVPIGVAGELYIGGVGLARGYRNLPEMTRERFVENPFRAGTRIYRTGDRARYRADGVIEYLGRLDHQVKLRGHRIELGEIESSLRRYEGVREAVAVVRTDHAADPRLVAYVVSPEKTVDTRELRAHLMKTLPGYMIPAAFVTLEKMPLTPNGKVDRKALPAPDSQRVEDGRPYVAPRSTTEEVLADIWRGVLRVEQIGVEDNFFESGGHSLMATQVLSRVRESFQVELSLKRFFESPVIADQAVAIEQAMVEEIQNMTDGENTEQVVAHTAAADGRTL